MPRRTSPGCVNAVALGDVLISNGLLVRAKDTVTVTVPCIVWKSVAHPCFIAASATIGMQATGISVDDALNGLADMLENLFLDHAYDYSELVAQYPADMATKQSYARNMYKFNPRKVKRIRAQWPPPDVCGLCS